MKRWFWLLCRAAIHLKEKQTTKEWTNKNNEGKRLFILRKMPLKSFICHQKLQVNPRPCFTQDISLWTTDANPKIDHRNRLNSTETRNTRGYATKKHNDFKAGYNHREISLANIASKLFDNLSTISYLVLAKEVLVKTRPVPDMVRVVSVTALLDRCWCTDLPSVGSWSLVLLDLKEGSDSVDSTSP